MAATSSTDSSLTQPILGIDVGTSSSKVAYIKQQTVEIVQNEVNNRQTPTVVGFTRKQRLEGDAAQSLIKSNLKNTVRYFKHCLGRKVEAVKELEEIWSLAGLRMDDRESQCGYGLEYLEEQKVFSVMQIWGMYLTKVRDISIKWCDFHGGGKRITNGITDDKKLNVVMSCPAYYSDPQRRALVDAASLAGMQTLRILSDGAAAAISYGPYRVDDMLKDETFVAFCSCGHSCFSVAIVRFCRDGLQLISEICDRGVGGRAMDLALMKHFAQEFQTKNKGAGDPLTYKKSILKLEEAVQKTKKVLSSNDVAPIGTECLVEDYDFSSSISRETFETLCGGLIDKYRALIRETIARAQIEVSQLDYVEMIGGSMRVPWVKRICQEEFQKEQLSTTLNADESVVRGCALQAAILSPLYKVRDYNIWLYSQRGISIQFCKSAEEKKVVEVFPMLTPLNIIKVLTCYRPQTFEINAFYTDDPEVSIGSYIIECDNPDKKKIQVHGRLDVNAIFSLEAPVIFDAAGANPQPLQFSKITLPGINEEDMAVLKQTEVEMQQQIHLMVKLENLRNDLETLLYKQRSICSSQKLDEITTPEERQSHLDLLQSTEDWLYDYEDTSTAGDVEGNILEVTVKFCKLAERGPNGAVVRNAAVSELKEVIEELKKKKEKVNNALEVEGWLGEMQAKQAGLGVGDVPELLGGEIRLKLKSLQG